MKHYLKAGQIEKNSEYHLYRSILPFIERFEETLWSSGGYTEFFTDKALAEISKTLFARLVGVSKYTLLSMRNWKLFGNFSPTQEDRERAGNEICSWLVEQGGWKERLARLPELKHYIDVITSDYKKFIEEFRSRYCRDRVEIGEVFNGGVVPGKIACFDAVGDSHAGGRCVIVLTLDGPGNKFVYKPRDVSTDACYEKLVRRWFSQITYSPRILVKKDDTGSSNYGYAEFIEHSPVKEEKEIGTFFENEGGLLAMGYFLGATDLHRENIIAMSSKPVVVDAETLMSCTKSNLDMDRIRRSDSFEAEAQDSVLRIQILPVVNLKLEGEAIIASSPLYGDGPDLSNLPVLNGKKINAEGYEQRILTGFRNTYRKIMENRRAILEELKMFSSCRFRFVLRGTPIYVRLIMRCMSSDIISESGGLKGELDRMDNVFGNGDEKSQELLRISQAEKAALYRGDIPLFQTLGEYRDIYDEGGNLLCKDFFQSSCIEHAAQIFKKAGEDDLAFQEKLIWQTLEPIPLKNCSFSKMLSMSDEYGKIMQESFLEPLPDEGEILKEAEDIFLEHEKRLLGAPKCGDRGWLTKTDFSDVYSVVGPLGPSLYEGDAGLGVFFAALGSISANERIVKRSLDLTYLCVEHARCLLRDFKTEGMPRSFPYGYASGLSGLILSLLLISGYMKDSAIEELALSFFHLIREEHINEWKETELLNGIAGLAAVITDFEILKNSKKGASLMQACMDRILRMKTMPYKEGVRLWKTRDKLRVLSGFGHGQAGIGFALSRLADALNAPEAANAALDAFRYEHSVFDEEHCNWPNLRQGSEWPFMFGLCYGAPGIGMAALQCKNSFPFLEEDLERAIRFSKDFFRIVPTDHLCCGNCSVIDFLLEVGSEELRETALHYLAAVIRKKERLGTYIGILPEKTGYYRTSLLNGSAGVAYTMLRCLKPDYFRTVAY